MADATTTANIAPSGTMRIAVEGCGHGTLDAIYASIEKSCETKGWNGVDLVIIGGDFQAVRNKFDLNVTAMPTKYRDMADFHQYYSGIKRAPYLTIFVGGNHEASNHLFELYYGGWVAPNIYYLGAANVIQVGPLKIASMSGIWKGYDYRKPHYERLPYSHDDMYSIYHVRELDVRKLLAYRSQVDIGISHDWPKGIEWLGNHDSLFRHKSFLREDAESGKLGNTAAQKVMDRLRPSYWFSAHLHTKYGALKTYETDNAMSHKQEPTEIPQKIQKQSENLPFHASPHQEQLSAWNNFGTVAKEEEAAETVKLLEEGKTRREEAERSGLPATANYTLNETYKKVRLGNGFARDVTSVSYTDGQSTLEGRPPTIPQLDGSCASLPLKRRREMSSSPKDNEHAGTKYTPLNNQQINGSQNQLLGTVTIENPDAIDIDMSDDETTQLTAADALQSEGNAADSYPGDGHAVPSPSDLNALDVLPTTNEGLKSTISKDPYVNPMSLNGTASDHAQDHASDKIMHEAEHGNHSSEVQEASNEVSDEMRAQLAALSSKFEEPVPVSAPLPHPEDIKNKTTRFLALSKCEDRQNFLQLLEIGSYATDVQQIDRPVKLSYVPEWLAILRVFASELTLGGNSKDHVPQHRGDTYYREKIVGEEKWVQERIVDKGLLDIPENFERTVPVYDPSMLIDDRDMPREVSNPQTSSFCALISIVNVFNISEEERDARMAAGPSESIRPGRNDRGGRGGHRGGQRGGFSRGGRGRPNRGYGRGRGRG